MDEIEIVQLRAPDENKHEGKEVVVHIPEDLEPLLSKPASWPECCIYKVPEPIRKVNPAAYSPQVISIGPIHHEDVALRGMEEMKLRYLAEFCVRTGKRWRELEKPIKESERIIRRSHQENFPSISSNNFAKLILLDSVFVLELFLKNMKIGEHNQDFIVGKQWLLDDIRTDLILLENQLPYNVLEELYNFAFSNQAEIPFFKLSCSFFRPLVFPPEVLSERSQKSTWDCFSCCYCFWINECFFCLRKAKLGDGQGQDSQPPVGEIQGFDSLTQQFEEEHRQRPKEKRVKHFVDLVRKFRTWLPQASSDGDPVNNLYCATKLHQAGVKFEVVPKTPSRNLSFDRGVLRMPMFAVGDETEAVIRNILAFEQCHYPNESYMCAFVVFLGSLIANGEDVNVLVRSRVLVNWLGSNEEVAKLVNGLSKELSLTVYPYIGICRELNRHCENWWYRKVAILRRVYFSNLWRGTGTIAGIVLLILTLLQTIYSMK